MPSPEALARIREETSRRKELLRKQRDIIEAEKQRREQRIHELANIARQMLSEKEVERLRKRKEIEKFVKRSGSKADWKKTIEVMKKIESEKTAEAFRKVKAELERRYGK